MNNFGIFESTHSCHRCSRKQFYPRLPHQQHRRCYRVIIYNELHNKIHYKIQQSDSLYMCVCIMFTSNNYDIASNLLIAIIFTAYQLSQCYVNYNGMERMYSSSKKHITSFILHNSRFI
jgi:hypothetical protein